MEAPRALLAFHSPSAVVVRASSPLQQHKTRLCARVSAFVLQKQKFINTAAAAVDNIDIEDEGDTDVVAEIHCHAWRPPLGESSRRPCRSHCCPLARPPTSNDPRAVQQWPRKLITYSAVGL